MAESITVLVVNPGSTSTKIALFRQGALVAGDTFRHDVSLLASFPSLWSQLGMRLDLCRSWARTHVETCDAVASLGGLLKPLPGGTYRVTETILNDARANIQGEHASNLGCALAAQLAADYRCAAYIADPVSVDEFEPLAYYSGHPEIARKSLSHALNIHAAARWGAEQRHRPADESSFIVVHLGGGISVAPVKCGKIIDVNDAASDGPFSPERTGGLPLQQFITLCCNKQHSESELRRMVMGKGGLVAYLGTNSVMEVEQRIADGDPVAGEVLDAMAYQIAKEIGAMATVLKGNIEAIILTGGGANSSILTNRIAERVRFLAPVLVHPGDDEMKALYDSVQRILRGEEKEREYST
jgi:butyrate kinase